MSMHTTYTILSHILLLGILLDKNAEMTVAHIEINNQNSAVKSLALKYE